MAYDLYHPAVRRWIYTAGWERLHEAQEMAAAPILAGDRDVIIAAATASGKSEAAWLPICSTLLRRREAGLGGHGVQAVVVSPLKALINDQYQRLTDLCAHLDIPVHRWHGDVARSSKVQLLRAPGGILLITPESIEAFFVHRATQAGEVLADLRHLVVDELHSFIGTPRGAQLQCLLHRVELLLGRRVPRIALSATLGDLAEAARFLRPHGADTVEIVSSTDDTAEVCLQLRGYLTPHPGPRPGRGGPRSRRPQVQNPASPDSTGPPGTHQTAGTAAGDPHEDPAAAPIADHLFRTLQRNDNLIFVNSRAAVEMYADMLSRRSHAARSRAEFLAHHGSLAKDIREHVEERLRDPSTPVTAICTSTLELGIDVGSVDSVAQVGAPLTVSGLRQRLGRSGRRPGQPAVLRLYVSETVATRDTPPPDALRGELFQTVAMVELLLDAWFEPPHTAGLHLSTLIQQILSVLAQYGGCRAAELHQMLCGVGPFTVVDPGMFATLLRDMAAHDLIFQDARGQLLPGDAGERLINHHSFFAAFQTSQDHRLIAHGRTLGTLPVERPILPGTLLIFGGRRWRVVSVDVDRRVIQLTESGAGQPPAFPGNGGEVADAVRRTMRDLYLSDEVPRYLDPTAQTLLGQGREVFHATGHPQQKIFEWDGATLLFPWRGDRVMNTLSVVLAGHGMVVGQDGLCLTVRGTTPVGLWELLGELSTAAPPDALDLAAGVRVKTRDKYDRYLGRDLLDKAYAARALDVPETWDLLGEFATLPVPL